MIQLKGALDAVMILRRHWMLHLRRTLETAKALDASPQKNTGNCDGTGCFTSEEHWKLRRHWMLHLRRTLEIAKALDASPQKNTGNCEGTGCFTFTSTESRISNTFPVGLGVRR
jgi:hypothetical protein